MTDALAFLAPALAMCLVVASVHVYLGMHVLARGVIFVDLALAQLAALGATVAGLLYASHEDDAMVHVGAFAFTVLGAAVFALSGRARGRVSQEAIVGIVYAVASSVMVLVLARAPHGAEHIQAMLVGSLLLSDWPQVLHLAAAYAVLGGVLIALRGRFEQLSWHPDRGSSMAWDFVFYLLFGLVITLSVQVAGVLLVFSCLIVPAVATQLFWQGLFARLLAGWLLAMVASLGGLGASWAWDLPAGAAIVATFGALLAAVLALDAGLRSS